MPRLVPLTSRNRRPDQKARAMASPSWNRPPGYPYGARVPHPPPVVAGYGGPQPAGIGRRLAARLIDYVLVGVFAFGFLLLVAMLLAIGGVDTSQETSEAEDTVWGLLLFFGWGPALFFYDWLFLIAWGRTLGKMLVSVKVVRATDGGPLTQGQAVGRSAFFGLPQTFLCVGHLFTLVECLVALSDQNQRALHDKAAGTLVIRT